MTKEKAIYQTICQLEIKRYRAGITQLEKVLEIALDIWITNCNLTRDIYPVVAYNLASGEVPIDQATGNLSKQSIMGDK